jgi:proteic killer suppression protein
VIRSFADREAERIFWREHSRRYATIESAILRKLSALNAANSISELAVPWGNRLEALKGDRKGQHSIRVNQQYRICFRWEESHVYEVEIVDYH